MQALLVSKVQRTASLPAALTAGALPAGGLVPAQLGCEGNGSTEALSLATGSDRPAGATGYAPCRLPPAIFTLLPPVHLLLCATWSCGLKCPD
jgi:hypothetical protein